MELKLDDAGHAVLKDGKPVYITEDGGEIAFDAHGTTISIAGLNSENKARRAAERAAVDKLKKYEAIADPDEAVKALDIVRGLDAKKLIDAGKASEATAAAVADAMARHKPIIEERDTLKALAESLTNQLYQERIGGRFSRSKFIAEKLTQPADIIEARFGASFKDEDGKITAYDKSGNKIYSRSNPGELADFDEALEVIIDQYPYKDSLLKGTGGGSGAKPGSGSNGAKVLSRAAFEALSPADKAAKMKDGFTLTD